MTIHNEAKLEDIAKVVLMPGDPLRAKYIAENFLEDYRLVNSVRNILTYTGKYKGKEITVMASGMGMPSMGIYAYELYKFYDVDYIIRIGSCGAYAEYLDLLDVILVDKSYNEGNFAKTMTNEECHIVSGTEEVNNIIEETAKEKNEKCVKANIVCAECFDIYVNDIERYIERMPKEKNIAGIEMESFALFYTAKQLGKKAACLLTVVDTYLESKKQSLTPEQRQNSLNNMIKLALDSSLKLK